MESLAFVELLLNDQQLHDNVQIAHVIWAQRGLHFFLVVVLCFVVVRLTQRLVCPEEGVET